MFWHLYGQEENAMEKGKILSALMILNQANLEPYLAKLEITQLVNQLSTIPYLLQIINQNLGGSNISCRILQC